MSSKPLINIIFVGKVLFVFLWIGLFALLLKRDYMVESLQLKETQALSRSQEESYLGVYFKNERIGYVHNRFIPDESGRIHLEQHASILLRILNENHPITLSGKATLSANFLLQTFQFSLKAPFYTMDVTGEVSGNSVSLIMDTGKQEIRDRLLLKGPPFIATNRRAYLLTRDLKVGQKKGVPYFDPFTQSVQNSVVTYHGKKKVLIQGRVHNLHHFTESYAGIRVGSWLNDQGNVVKEESPAGFVFIAEPEFRAKDIKRASTDVLAAVAVPLQGEMPDLTSLSAIKYRLTLPADAELTLHKDRQALVGNILTVQLETIADNSTLSACGGQEGHLMATPYLQVGHKKIAQVVRSLDLALLSPVKQVEKISLWVYENLQKKPVVGVPDAVTTLESLRGDCNEHAALFAALARNAGIPARIVAGVSFHKGAFYYHAWNEVCIGEKWISVDTTLNQIPTDLGHIKFIEGETREQLKIGALLGNLQIEVLSAEQHR